MHRNRFHAGRSRTHRVAVIALAILTLGITVTPSHALPVNYFEAGGGDLPQAAPLPVFTLDVGVNTIIGDYGNDGPAVDFDSFAILVPAGKFVTDGEVVAADLSGAAHGAVWSLYAGSATPGLGTYLEAINPTSPGSDPIPALAPNTYNFTHGGILGSGSSTYIFTFNVVPEPTSLSLLAIAGTALLRRRTR